MMLLSRSARSCARDVSDMTEVSANESMVIVSETLLLASEFEAALYLKSEARAYKRASFTALE